MPLSKAASETLSEIATRQVSEQIVNFCIQSRRKFSIAKLVRNEVNSRSKTFSDLCQEYLFPNNLQDEILQRSLKIWEKKKVEFLNLPKSEDEKMYILIHYLCLSKICEWKFELKLDETKSLDFMLNFNKNLRELKISKTIMPVTLERILTNMSNIVFLDINYKIYEKGFSVIGRICGNLEKLHVFRPGLGCAKMLLDQGMIGHLCFSNYPDENTKNTICNSLKYLNAFCTMEATLMILKQFRNLKEFKTRKMDLNYNDVVKEDISGNWQVFPCSLKSINVSLDNEHGDIDSVLEKLPELTSIKLLNYSILDGGVNVTYNLVSLEINFDTNVAQIHIYLPYWKTLRKLSLVFDSLDMINFDFSHISSQSPNLQVLSLMHCDHEEQTEVIPPFLELKHLRIIQGEIMRSNLLSHVAPTLVTLRIEPDDENVFGQYCVTTELLNYHFPRLEELFYCEEYDVQREKILELIESCLVLRKFSVVGQDPDVQDWLEDQCVLKGWNLNILSNAPELNIYFQF